MTLLRIVAARDSLLWYADKIGQEVPHLGEWPGEGYKSREPAGYVNIVFFEDAEVVEG